MYINRFVRCLYSVNLNQNRLYCEKVGDYNTAEFSLAQIQNIRQQAETGLKVSLGDKHLREGVQIEEQNRLEFEQFT